jgi:hypothetical protein
VDDTGKPMYTTETSEGETICAGLRFSEVGILHYRARRALIATGAADAPLLAAVAFLRSSPSPSDLLALHACFRCRRTGAT